MMGVISEHPKEKKFIKTFNIRPLWPLFEAGKLLGYMIWTYVTRDTAGDVSRYARSRVIAALRPRIAPN